MSLSLSVRRPVATVAVTVAALLGVGLPALGAGPAAAAEAAGVEFAGFTDKSQLHADGRGVVASGELVVTDGSAPQGSGTTYFVDSQSGDDTADGRSAATAWRTFANINGSDFHPGDRILLKAGSSWSASGTEVAREAYDYTTWSSGQPTNVSGPDATALLAPGGSGTAEAPIVLSSYGDGAAPELHGLGVVNDVLQLNNQEHWDISNLEISNETAGFDATTFQPARNLGQAPGDENPATGDLRGIHVQAENAGTLRGYDIHNVFIRDVTGYTWSVSAAGLDRSKRTGGILFEGLKGDAQTASQFEDISIRDNYIANTAFANLVFKQFAGMGTNRYQDLPPGWGDRAAGRAAPDGTLTEDPDWRPHSNVEITGNYLTNRDTQYGWDSMYLTSVRGATVEDNLIDGAGVSGIEMYYADNIVVQNNEVAELEGRTGAADSNGIDPDRGTSNILIQGNYVHGSGEGILLCGFGFSTAVVRYNIIRDIERNYINPHGDTGVNVVYNNLMYNTVQPIRNNTVGFFESSGNAASYLNARNPHYVFNNVFFNTRPDVAGAAFRTQFPGVSFSNNSYFGPGVTAPSADAQATVTDPLLKGDLASGVTNAMIGSADSPLINAGRAVDLGQIAPGFGVTGARGESQVPLAVDFFGRSLSTPPHIGPTSYEPAEGYGVISGMVTDADGHPVAGATVSYGAGTTTADVRGRYSLEIPAGGYTLVASAEGYADGEPVTVALADRQTLTTPLSLGATTATEGTIAGVVTSSGSGLDGAEVKVLKGDQTVATATTDASGAYALPGVAMGAGYTVVAAKEGYEPASQADVEVTPARTVTVNLVLRREVGETTYAINETFDDEAVGAFTATTDGVLTARSAPAAGTIEVVADAADAGNSYLRINKSSATSATLGVHNTAELNLTGTVTVEARLQRTTTNGTPNQLALYSYSESSWNASNPAGSANPSATIGFAGGNIITHNVTGSSSVRSVAPYAVGQWYTVRNVVDLDSGTFDFYIDDMATPVLIDQPLRTKVDDLDYFLFFINGSNVGDLLVDYFRVNIGTPYDYADASLASVSAATAEGEVELTASADGLTFAGEVDAFAEEIAISAAARSGFATVQINGTAADPGESVSVPLAGGAASDPNIVTTIPVVVRAEDGSERTHSISISRVNPSQLAALRDLQVAGHSLTPEFDPARHGGDDPYRLDGPLEASVSSVDLSWRLGWEGQVVQINGEDVAAGASGARLPLEDGENRFEVTVNSFAGDFATYLVVIDRAIAEPQLDVTAEIDTRCAGRNVVLVVRVTNAEQVPLSLTLETSYRSKQWPVVPAGKSRSHPFNTGLAEMPAGTVAITASALVEGEQIQLTREVAYDSAGC
ncbi:carboxypeptidase regulatory-like domain-containing protein [Microbacterium sp. HD4P20]|uniref:carboxypeptidase regulatory-like domain-containing protein n=1 Tax=Microbacterium sp. HD4P20 TaxID=2864874 RepID=UPI001C63C5B1|nr:carboxypeptidase regulatory-like domain-containing protein [Microbacterium sp. HD4P20]MCP2635153.1 carboxypeptidase regulatory-like domain-containing protein [Microbacterium sp. HD4P20]